MVYDNIKYKKFLNSLNENESIEWYKYLKSIENDAKKAMAIVLIGDNLFHKKDYLSINKKDLEAFI